MFNIVSIAFSFLVPSRSVRRWQRNISLMFHLAFLSSIIFLAWLACECTMYIPNNICILYRYAFKFFLSRFYISTSLARQAHRTHTLIDIRRPTRKKRKKNVSLHHCEKWIIFYTRSFILFVVFAHSVGGECIYFWEFNIASAHTPKSNETPLKMLYTLHTVSNARRKESGEKKWNMASAATAAAKTYTALIVKTLMWWHYIALALALAVDAARALSCSGCIAKDIMLRGRLHAFIFLYIIMGASDIYHNIITPQINAYTFRLGGEWGWWKSNLCSLKFFALFFSRSHSNYSDRVS